MSWKIYNGFIFETITTLENALVFLRAQIKDFNIEADEYWKGMILSHAIAEYDNDCAEGLKPDKQYINKSREILWEHERVSSNAGHKSLTDTSITVSVCPVKISGRKRIIGMVHCDNNRLRDKFFTLPGIIEYAYFNNSDRPEEITAREWKIRENTWKKLFSEYATANKIMYGFDIIAEKESIRSPRISEEDLQKYSIPFEERLKGAINHRLLLNKTFSDFQSYTEYMRSEEVMESRKTIEPLVRARLAPVITLVDVTGAKYN